MLTTDYRINARLSRTSSDDVYAQIIEDLNEATDLLDADFLDGSLQKYSNIPERLRPTRWVAKALLARVYLAIKDYTNADAAASAIIDGSSLFTLNPLSDVFLKDNTESIWQLQPINSGFNTEDAIIFVLPSSGPSDVSLGAGNPVYISLQLINSFEAGDQRRLNWIDSVSVVSGKYYYPFKYKKSNYGDPLTECLVAFRLAEQYLIRAEARTHQNNFSGAQADLNKVRSRAGLGNTAADTEDELLSAILHERKVELFSEFGHRWLDLKRTGKVDEVMTDITPQKGQWSALAKLSTMVSSSCL